MRQLGRRARLVAAVFVITNALAWRPATADAPWPTLRRAYLSGNEIPAASFRVAASGEQWSGFVGDTMPATRWVIYQIGFLPDRVLLVDPVRRLVAEVRTGESPWYVEHRRLSQEIANALPSRPPTSPLPAPRPRTAAWYAELAVEYRNVGRFSEAGEADRRADSLAEREAPTRRSSPRRNFVTEEPVAAASRPSVSTVETRSPPDRMGIVRIYRAAAPAPTVADQLPTSADAPPEWDRILRAAEPVAREGEGLSLTDGVLTHTLIKERKLEREAEVHRYLLLTGNVAKPLVERLLRAEFDTVRQHADPSPTTVLIEAYTTIERYKVGGEEQRLARLVFGPPPKTEVETQFNESLYSRIPPRPEVRFGLEEPKRIKVYRMLGLIDAFTNPVETADPLRDSATREEYRARAAREFGVSTDQLVEIESEGLSKAWPKPVNIFEPAER